MSELLGRYSRIEGIDGSGKSTQINLAKKFSEANNLDAFFIREPGASPLGEELRRIILSSNEHQLDAPTEYALFTAGRLDTYSSIIMPKLKEGLSVISDRGVESSFAYQSAGGGISKEAIWGVAELLLPPRYMRPDGLAILSLTKKVWRERLEKRFAEEEADKIEARSGAYFDRVFDAYKELEKRPEVTVIDANEGTPEELFEYVKPVLFGKL
jgi:dTMP kinase